MRRCLICTNTLFLLAASQPLITTRLAVNMTVVWMTVTATAVGTIMLVLITIHLAGVLAALLMILILLVILIGDTVWAITL